MTKMKFIPLPVLLVSLISCASESKDYTTFNPGQEWEDDHGVHINAHGGGGPQPWEQRLRLRRT
jgi:hypothetical protein